MTHTLLGASDPLGALYVVGDGGRKTHDSAMLRQHDDRLFPHHTSFLSWGAERRGGWEGGGRGWEGVGKGGGRGLEEWGGVREDGSGVRSA